MRRTGVLVAALAGAATLLVATPTPTSAGVCTIVGSDGADVITGTPGPDQVCGLGGDDRLVGLGGDDVLIGGTGDDMLVGKQGADRLIGGAGHDSLVPGAGDDSVEGGPDRDNVSYRDLAGGVVVDLPAGIATGAQTGADALLSIEGMTGTTGDDTLIGTLEKEYVEGIGGDDVIRPGGGFETVRGGAGEDVLDYSDFTVQGVQVSLANGTAWAHGKALIDRFEVVIGSPQGDSLGGDAGHNVLVGGGGDDDMSVRGDDHVDAGPGSDDIWVYAGSSTIDGGTGYDTLMNSLQAHDPLWVDLAAGTYDKGDRGVDEIVRFEEVWGTRGPDHLYGGLGATRVTFWAFGGADDVNTQDGFGGDRIHASTPGSTATCTSDPDDVVDC